MFTSTHHDSTFGIVTRLWDELSRVQNPAQARNFSPKHQNRLWGPLSLLFNGYRDSLLGG